MRVAIHHEEQYGWVDYDPISKEVMVTHPNELVSNTVRHYLKQDREMTFPANNEQIGNRIQRVITPLDSASNLEMALVEMFHATGVHVNWSIKEMEEDNPDKIISKSLFGGDIYEIIN